MPREKTLFKFFCEYLNYPYILFMTSLDYNYVLPKKKKKIHITPLSSHNGHLSVQRPLSSVPEVAVLERFDVETSAFYTYFCMLVFALVNCF